MVEYKFCFLEADLSDVVTLKNLLDETDCKTQFTNMATEPLDKSLKAMGIKEVLTIVITSGKQIYQALKLWFEHRRTKIVVYEKQGDIETKYEIDTSNPDDVDKILSSIQKIK